MTCWIKATLSLSCFEWSLKLKTKGLQIGVTLEVKIRLKLKHSYQQLKDGNVYPHLFSTQTLN